MKNNEEKTKIAKEAKFATLGRALADYTMRGDSITLLVNETQTLRQIEQDSVGKETQFASLARQVGDAARSGREITTLLMRLVELRQREVG